MRGTWRKTRNGWVVTGPEGEEWVAEDTVKLLPVFEAMVQEERLIHGSEPAGEYQGLLSSMRGAALAIVRGERENGREGESLDEPQDWPSTLPGSDGSTSEDVAGPEPAPADEVTYTPATEDGYEFPAVRGPKNGRREIHCPDHGWQLAVIKDGAYRCQFKPSPKQVCTNPGTPKDMAEKRLVPA